MLRRLARTTPTSTDFGLLALRVWFGLVLAFGHGLGKVGDLPAFGAKVAGMGMPAAGLLAGVAALSEFSGGILLAIGLFSRIAAAFVLATMLTAAFFVHAHDPFAKKEFALAYAVAALCILIAGPGRLSADGRLFK